MNKSENDPLISVCCITYNHELYIQDTIEGFIKQKTTFPVEIIIHDDASTDKTAEIIKNYFVKYPDLIIPILQTENQYSKGIRAYPNYVWPLARGKYIALCEGDDYWTDPFKLQKQVDFLAANPEYGLVHSELDHYYVTSRKIVRNYWAKNKIKNQSGDIYNSLMMGQKSMIYACTACFRAEFVNGREYQKIVDQRFLMGDAPLWILIALKSKIGYLKESTAVRNVLPFSATQGKPLSYMIEFIESRMKVFEYFNNIKSIAPFEKGDYINKYYIYKMDLCFQFNENKRLFDSCFSLLDNEFKSNILILKRFGMRNNLSHFFIRILIMLHRKIFKLRTI